MARRRAKTISLRVTYDVHKRLERAADELGVSVNAVLNILITRSLGRLTAEALLLRDELKTDKWRPEWRSYQLKHPEADEKEFFDDYMRRLWLRITGQPPPA